MSESTLYQFLGRYRMRHSHKIHLMQDIHEMFSLLKTQRPLWRIGFGRGFENILSCKKGFALGGYCFPFDKWSNFTGTRLLLTF